MCRDEVFGPRLARRHRPRLQCAHVPEQPLGVGDLWRLPHVRLELF
jgi:hypothetical protein